jgi:3-dehydroquinate dehydratase/shikimate dehydrogenase
MSEILRLLERIARRRCASRGLRPPPRAQEAASAPAFGANGRSGSAARAGCSWIDVDAGTLESFPAQLRRAVLPPVGRIVSWHDFERTPPLETLYRRLARLGADWVKIAVTPRTPADNVKLLAMTRRHRRRVISVAMGTLGLPGRLLALAAGSALTYAATQGGRASAPAQPTVGELRQTYRADRLNSRTRVRCSASRSRIRSHRPCTTPPSGTRG